MNVNRSVMAFSLFKPLCVNFLKDCNIENIEKLEKVLEDLDAESLQPLLEFIVLPFRAQLARKLPEKVTIRCINFLTHVVRKSRVDNWCFFSDIFVFMITKISIPQDINKVIDANEELKQSICENIICFVQRSTEEVLNEMYSLSFRPNLAHTLYVFNILLTREKSKTLQKVVLSAIGALVYSENYIGKKFKRTEEIASESLASCLPGVSIALQKVACGDIKQGHTIVTMALSILSDLIVLVVGDESYERGIANDTSSEIHSIAYKSGKQNLVELNVSDMIPVVMKDEKWFKMVSEKLEILIKNLTGLAGHDHWKVRLELLKFANSVLFKCTKTLQNCVPVLLPVVFGLSVDDNDAVSSYCSNLVFSFSEHFQKMNCTSLNLIIEDNIEKLTSQLMKCKLTANDNKKLTALKSLQGYIEILGSSIDTFLFSMTHLERIILTLITLLEFDVSELNLVEEIPDLENFNMVNLVWPKKRFKFFENEEILHIICKICYSLGHIQNSRLLIEYLLEQLSCNNLYTLQCIFVIGNIIKGYSNESNASEKYSELVNDVLEVFLSSTMFDVPVLSENNLLIQNRESSSVINIPNKVFNENKLQICLLLEAIGKCSECLGNEFKAHLIKVLCPVMEKAGSSICLISQYGQLCLCFISESCKYNSVRELIKDNADYVTNMLLVNFHQYLYKHESAIVLRIAMEQSHGEAIVLFRDLIFHILNILDYNQNKAYFFMSILFSVIVSIKKWFPSKKNSSVNNPVSRSILCNNLRSKMLDYITIKKTVLTLEPENLNDEKNEQTQSDTDDAVNDDSSEENKTNTPLHVNITCEIFKRCIHLQSSDDVYLRMLTLETVELCILILRDFENELHPLVHEFWSPFLNRFTEGTFISKAFNVLLAIANECGDFIRSRTFKEVVPKLILFLKQEYSKSYMKCNFRHYQWTSDHSLQVLMLSEVGNLCTKLDINEKIINDVINICMPYLEKEQPKVLQDAAIKSLKALASIDPDAVWYYWKVLYSEGKILIPPHKDLQQLSFPHSNNSLTTVKIEF